MANPSETEATATDEKPPEHKAGSVRCLNVFNFLAAQVQAGIGPFLVVYLATVLKWKPSDIGLVTGISAALGVAAQLPLGGLVDHTTKKRGIVIGACMVIGAATAVMAFFPTFLVITAAQGVVTVAGALFGPAIGAISLGLVGRRAFDRQTGRNQTYSSAGSVFNGIALGICGYFAAKQGVFWFVVVMCVITAICILGIKNDHVDDKQARGADGDDCLDAGDENKEEEGDKSKKDGVVPITQVFRDRNFLCFTIAATLFHGAAGGLAPLVSQVVARQVGKEAMFYQSALAVITQATVVSLSWWIGKRAAKSNRKGLIAVAFIVMPIRSILCVISFNPIFMVSLQVLEGAATAFFGVLQLLILADLTKGTGRFNLAQGALSAAMGIAVAVADVAGGYIVRYAGFHFAFTVMAAISVAALLFFWRFVPETKSMKDGQATAAQAA